MRGWVTQRETVIERKNLICVWCMVQVKGSMNNERLKGRCNLVVDETKWYIQVEHVKKTYATTLRAKQSE